MRMFVGEKIDLSNAEEQDIAEDEISDDTGNEIIDVNINKENSYVDADMDDYYQNINYEDFENEEFIYNDEVIYESYINENVEDDLIYEINSNIEGDEESQKSELELKVRRFLDDLKELQEKSMYMSTDEFLWYIYTNSGYYAYCGALPGGSQRQANLRILFERAKQFEETSFKGIFNFINFISKLKKSNSDMGSAKTLGENANVVRIMSIHKSKGLEFPIVICSGMGRNFNMQNKYRKYIRRDEDIICCSYKGKRKINNNIIYKGYRTKYA